MEVGEQDVPRLEERGAEPLVRPSLLRNRQMVGGLRSGMGYCGVASIPQLQCEVEMVQITSAGLRESHPHDVTITAEGAVIVQDNGRGFATDAPRMFRSIVEATCFGAKKISESFIELLFPDALNKGLMTLTDSWWRYKWQRKNYPMEDYDLAMKTRLYVSKNHPANYQKKILRQLKLQFNT